MSVEDRKWNIADFECRIMYFIVKKKATEKHHLEKYNQIKEIIQCNFVFVSIYFLVRRLSNTQRKRLLLIWKNNIKITIYLRFYTEAENLENWLVIFMIKTYVKFV